MLPWSDWVVPSARKTGDEGEGASLHRPFDNPHDAVREHGTYGDEGKAVRRGSADGFAVCGLYLLRTNLRTAECKFGTRSKGVGEHYAGKHEGKCHADKSESKAIFGMRTRRLFFRTLLDVCFLK